MRKISFYSVVVMFIVLSLITSCAGNVDNTQVSGDITIELESHDIDNSLLTLRFTFENMSGEEISMGTFNWVGWDSEGDSLLRIYDESICVDRLPSEVMPGETVTGNLCYMITGNSPYKIEYSTYDDAGINPETYFVWTVE